VTLLQYGSHWLASSFSSSIFRSGLSPCQRKARVCRNLDLLFGGQLWTLADLPTHSPGGPANHGRVEGCV
jgi:hypothetical protein